MTEAAIKETRGFEAEVKQLLHLMIHALYSNKEIFLRELISNASDAQDKLRFNAISNNELYENDSDLKILVDFDEKAKTITIRDNGIGMTRDEVINNLGTIAKSGTQEFLNSLTGDKARDSNLIGQFGVGFYSAFIVADKVEVYTRKAGVAASAGVKWVSEGQGEYSVETIDKTARGTEIILHIKPDETEFLNGWRLRNIITKYSDHINFPVIMPNEKMHSDNEENNNDVENSTQEIVNEAKALWTIPKSEIDDEAYVEFYKKIARDFEAPLTWGHNKVEGKLDYISLLYIPARAPFDLWQADKPRGLKLYVKRVFIMDDAAQFLPNYLRFVRGLIDSNDLPLNISREILQSNKIIESIKTAVTKRILSMLAALAQSDKDKYVKLWKEFGLVLKEGPAEDFTNKEEIAKLLRFSSTYSDLEAQNVSLQEYVERMNPEQDKIYYISAETFNAAKNSPHLEIFRKKNIEVLLLSDRIDEWLMSHLTEFAGKKLYSVTRGNLDEKTFKTEDKINIEEVENNKDTLARIKEALGDKVKDVCFSQRLTSSPSCIVVDEHAMSAQMERILKAAGQYVAPSKPILEVNPDHVLFNKIKHETNGEKFANWSNILLEQAILAEGGHLENPAAFVKRFNELLLDVVK